MCLTGLFSFVPTMFFYSLPPSSRSHHPSLALSTPLDAPARLQVHHPRGERATSRMLLRGTLILDLQHFVQGVTEVGRDPSSATPHARRQKNQTTSGTGQGVDLQPSFHRDEMDQPFQCLGYRPLTLFRPDWRLLTGKPIANTARSLFSSPLLPARQGFVYQYIEAVPRASMPLNDCCHMTASEATQLRCHPACGCLNLTLACVMPDS